MRFGDVKLPRLPRGDASLDLPRCSSDLAGDIDDSSSLAASFGGDAGNPRTVALLSSRGVRRRFLLNDRPPFLPGNSEVSESDDEEFDSAPSLILAAPPLPVVDDDACLTLMYAMKSALLDESLAPVLLSCEPPRREAELLDDLAGDEAYEGSSSRESSEAGSMPDGGSFTALLASAPPGACGEASAGADDSGNDGRSGLGGFSDR